MKKRIFFLIIVGIIAFVLVDWLYYPVDSLGKGVKGKYGIVIHGGAGNISKNELSEEQQREYVKVMEEAIEAANKILENDGSCLDAIEKAINILEDSPLFNAGKGAVFNADGKNELDAAIMDGASLKCGAVAGLMHIKNPISLARLVMEKTPHVFLIREGAENFAVEQGIELVSEDYFFTERRWKSFQKVKEEEEKKKKGNSMIEKNGMELMFGTVGACALDKKGNIAAGTSTGGMTYKRSGRVGDSPIIGAGTYANNKTCAVSATGHGEYFIRNVVAYDISAQILYKRIPLQKAAENALKKIDDQGATGGVIAIDASGNIAMPFNTNAMFRAFSINGSKPEVRIYK